MVITSHRKNITRVDVKEKELKVNKNGVYESEFTPFTRVEVNVLPTLEVLVISKNGIYKSEKDGFSEVNVNVPVFFSFKDLGYKLKRVHWKGGLYMALTKGDISRPSEALSSSFRIIINAESKYSYELFPCNDGSFISKEYVEEFSEGNEVKVYCTFNDMLLTKEVMKVNGEVTLFE